MLGPSSAFFLIYFLVSVLFVNTTDRHLLTTNREMKRYHASLYHRAINFVHEKMLFVHDKKPKHHITNTSITDSTAVSVAH